MQFQNFKILGKGNDVISLELMDMTEMLSAVKDREKNSGAFITLALPKSQTIILS